MGQLNDKVQAWTEKVEDTYHGSKPAQAIGVVAETLDDVATLAGKAVVLTLAKSWIGLGRLRNVDTNVDFTGDSHGESVFVHRSKATDKRTRSETGGLERFDYEKLWSVQLGEYFLPLSQTFTLRAKKKLNISSLVDGIDIIQETRKESKTIDCTLRIGLRGVKARNETGEGYRFFHPGSVQDNLQIVDTNLEMQHLSQFLDDLYESDAVFTIDNDMINNTFRVEHVIMTDYKFIPRAGMGTYTFEFSLTEVKYDENVLTLDLREVSPEAKQEKTELVNS
ncbi:MAG: hypothetical protein GX025_10050 [Clostridiales bacterium]|nr:hypothetical protein [Clostridiales bacterium]